MSLSYQPDLFNDRVRQHDQCENELLDLMRPFTDRRHLPDRRVSFAGIPVSFDVKTTRAVEDNSHDEYWRLWYEGEPVFIVYQDRYESDGGWYADWISTLEWDGPRDPSDNSTSGDRYYLVSGGRSIKDFLEAATAEARIYKGHCMYEAQRRGNI